MPDGDSPVERWRLAPALLAALLLAAAAGYALTRAQDAVAVADDPARIAARALDDKFNAAVAEREIAAALAANDSDLAQSFVDLAAARHVALDPATAAKVNAAVAEAATPRHKAVSFARGLVTGEPDDMASLAGTATGDLFVFGDIRDAVREGARFAAGQPVDELVLGLSCVGLAITAGTYASLGAGTPARVGLSLVKAARKTGRMGVRMAEWIGRTLRDIVDWSALRRAISGASISDPAVAVRAAREAVKVEKTDGLVRLVGDVGRVQSRAGTQAALDGLKLAETPRDVSRVARIAEKYGGKTRAVLKIGGRSVLFLTASAFNLFSWLIAAVMTVFGFCASCKRAAERATERHLFRRKQRRALERLRFAAMTMRGPAALAAAAHGVESSAMANSASDQEASRRA
jgi:hypothetical protein